ncbi:hypothetical protein [Polluticaenibacter yanchengensis]|uniref:Uncharacterized protein n=1 Tax=Polluticaenibacter yanchengensis TaxID=3014562 RepID=A0ABT4UNB4_9BACT|nr:hypothetical protein [Chitinophagaceae bacterium LY-5]
MTPYKILTQRDSSLEITRGSIHETVILSAAKNLFFELAGKIILTNIKGIFPRVTSISKWLQMHLVKMTELPMTLRQAQRDKVQFVDNSKEISPWSFSI